MVLENVERWLDKGLPVREAAINAMNEITGPILAITLVLIGLPTQRLSRWHHPSVIPSVRPHHFGVDDHLGPQRHDDAAGDMVPLGAVAEVRDSTGPVQITRYNMFPAATINGASRPAVSTGDVLATMEQLAQGLPRNMTTEWTELSYLQKQAGKVESLRDLQQNPFSAFVLGTVLVFFVLAGLYESWSLPLAVILVVPMCLLSALAGIALAEMDINIFVQVGFVVLVGLAAKNAILIVQFARDRQQEGVSRFEAAVEAARVRLRPIVMTSFAFILGVFPLVIAQGAGAEMRRTLGTAVFAGMIGVTLFGIFLTPVFYSVVRWFIERRNAPDTAAQQPPAETSATAPTGELLR